ncbi:MAG: hypothetical protein COA79_00625 [Planctomycetota bacterium]|nr:MAG: hypothetical protein COA79_00625 [Planctomycetota bacterium]
MYFLKWYHTTLKSEHISPVMTFFFNKAFLLISFSILILFSNRNLHGDDDSSDFKKWEAIVHLANRSTLSQITKKKILTHLDSMNSDIPISLFIKLKTNKSKLNLLLTLDENIYQSTIQRLLEKIEPDRINNDDSSKLLTKIISQKHFDISIDTNLDLLKKLQTKVLSNRNVNKDVLLNLLNYLKKNILINDAIEVSKKLWKGDKYYFEIGELHMLAYKFKYPSKIINHKEQAINSFNTILNKYPKSKYKAMAAISALSLQIKSTPPITIQILFKQAIYPHLNTIPFSNKKDLLNTLIVKLDYPEIISTLKEWYINEKSNLSENQFTNEILTFLMQKANFNISKLTELIKNQKVTNISEPNYFKNMLVEHKIQFLVYWKSPWEPYSDFSQKSTGIIKQKNNQLILKCKNTIRSSTKLILNDKNLLSEIDYIFLKIKNPSEGNMIHISVKINHQTFELSDVRPDNRWQLIRIPLKEKNISVNKIIIFFKSPTKEGNNYFFLTQPTHLKIKSLEKLQKEVK